MEPGGNFLVFWSWSSRYNQENGTYWVENWPDAFFHQILAELSLESLWAVPVVAELVDVGGVPGRHCGGEAQPDVRGEVEWWAVGHRVSGHWQKHRQSTGIYPRHFAVKLPSQSRQPKSLRSQNYINYQTADSRQTPHLALVWSRLSSIWGGDLVECFLPAMAAVRLEGGGATVMINSVTVTSLVLTIQADMGS